MKKRGQGIVKLNVLFEKYKRTLRAPQKSVITQAILTIHEVIPQIHLQEHECSYTPKTKTLTVRASGPEKTEILLKKTTILKKMQEALGERSAPNTIM